MRVKCISSLKYLFRSNNEVFWQKVRKFSTLERLENMMEKEYFFLREKRFHRFKSLLHKNGKAQNMPVVAGRLVAYITKMLRNFGEKLGATRYIRDANSGQCWLVDRCDNRLLQLYRNNEVLFASSNIDSTKS